ncbi:MAG: CaiB/BaiF CoA-transferase family protein [Desulfomonilaceae bacterium]|jgi:crotonobetainyl-CoA:carnitine CoA-transferase CaiB-like acyl-CoA transferase
MSQALSGLKVLDLTMNLPGPYMTWLLALLGAEVVKVENPSGGDYSRALLGDGQSSPFFAAVNRNKKSVGLNLKHPEGKRLFLKLLNHYDVLVEGFRPETMERLDLGFDVLSAINPRLIYVSISGYGQSGPNKMRAGHDLNYLALAGIIGMTGSRNGELAMPGVQIADLAGGSLMGLTGLLAAIIQRDRTGKGQFVDVSMYDGAFSMATMVFAGVEAGMEFPEPGKMMLNGRFPCYGLYKTSDGRYMSLGALESKFWKNFCMAVGREDLLDGQFGGPEVVTELARLFASKTQDEWTESMVTADACCEPVLNLNEAADSPLTQARFMVNRDPEGKRSLGFPLKLSESEPPTDEPAPSLGQHTREILAGLGITEKELQSLSYDGVI